MADQNTGVTITKNMWGIRRKIAGEKPVAKGKQEKEPHDTHRTHRSQMQWRYARSWRQHYRNSQNHY